MKSVKTISVRVDPHQLGQIAFIREYHDWQHKKPVEIIRTALAAYAKHLHEQDPNRAAEWWSFT